MQIVVAPGDVNGCIVAQGCQTLRFETKQGAAGPLLPDTHLSRCVTFAWCTTGITLYTANV